MARPTAKTKLLQACLNLMTRKGYEATTVDQICATADVSKGSFYHYFKSKEELVLQALDAFLETGRERFLDGPFRSTSDPVERAFGFLDETELKAEEIWSQGCLLGALATEIADLGSPIQVRLGQIVSELTTAMANLLAPLAKEGGGPSAVELAEHLLAIIEGRSSSPSRTAIRAASRSAFAAFGATPSPWSDPMKKDSPSALSVGPLQYRPVGSMKVKMPMIRQRPPTRLDRCTEER